MIGRWLRRLEDADGRTFAAVLFAAALLPRLAWLAGWEALGLDARLGHDPYPEIARWWLGWPGAAGSEITHPPVYPLAIAALWSVLRVPSALAVQAANVTLSAATCVLVAAWGERVAGRRAGRLAGLWTAADPGLVFFAPQLQSETFFLFVQSGFFLAWAAWDQRRPLAAWATGLLAGVASLTRSAFALYVPFALPFLFLRERVLKRPLLPLVLLALGWAAPIAVWTARNWAAHHRVIPFSVQGAHGVWMGLTLDPEEIVRRHKEFPKELAALGIQDDPFAADAYFKAKVAEWVKAHPGETAWILVGKMFKYWRPAPYPPYPAPVRLGLGLYFTALFALALWGIRERRDRWRDDLPFYLLAVYLTLLHAVFFNTLRYRLPLEPFLCLFASIGLLAVLRRRAL